MMFLRDFLKVPESEVDAVLLRHPSLGDGGEGKCQMRGRGKIGQAFHTT